MLAAYPAPSLYPVAVYFGRSSQITFVGLSVSQYLTLPILTLLYIYDRIVFKPDRMQKRYILIFSIYSIMTLLILVYAFIQKGVAEEHQLNAEQNAMEAQHNRAIMEDSLARINDVLKSKDQKIDSLEREITKLNH
jgi:hypothetical protein